MTTEQYLDSINKRFKLGNATEHTFRGDLQQLIESLQPSIRATNEPKRQSCGAPDYILTSKDVPIGFIEAKDIGDRDLDGIKKTGNKEQFDRYKASLNNLIFTDYLNFHLYRDGQFVMKITIGELTGKGIKPILDNVGKFESLIKDFCTHIGQTIKSSKRLAEMMAGKARLLSEVIEKSLLSDDDNHENSTLKDQMNAFKEILIHDISPKGFADVYAQTITYGLFAARLHDPTLPTFSRQEAFDLIPKSNPFLKKLFGYIAGIELDERIKWIVDDLVQIFLACNIEEMLKNYGKSTQMEDPIIHFYEDFLSEYDPKLRKARGVWYTPQPVVNFIVRAVDDLLKSEFKMVMGLADNRKIKIKVSQQNKIVEQEVHEIQVLDPATGTGTFLAEVIKCIHQKFKGQQGIWNNYVEEHLIPRINGFELLMASYAMAHLKLDLLLRETGFNSLKSQRLKIYLTNSLEESHPDTGTLFANWLSSEANEANQIKRDSPIMCVIGNPPYSISTTNKSKWIEKLISDYKINLNEKKINLDDDYIKFIRFGQHFIDKNKSGILAYISNNSFVEGITHRQMRSSLLKSFDKIYILDLHGNSRIKETCSDGTPDQNVFDIMQGVSINIFIKTGRKKENELGEVFHANLQGKRDFKYEFLNKNNIETIHWQKVRYSEPYKFFVNKNLDLIEEYNKGFKVTELFQLNSNGIETHRDDIAIQYDSNKMSNVVRDFIELSEGELKSKYSILKEGSEWKVSYAKKDAIKFPNAVSSIIYRPFDKRYTLFTPNSKGFLARPRYNVLNHLKMPNVALLVKRQCKQTFSYAFVVNDICEACVFESAFAKNNVLPLYLYSSGNTTERVPNFNLEIITQFELIIGQRFITEKTSDDKAFAPIDVFDYIYAVLHSTIYREKYKEFLRIDFPNVPYPKDKETFWRLVDLGGTLRKIHLLESPIVENLITEYPISGDNIISKIRYIENYEMIEGETISLINPVYPMGRVYINDNQFFQGVPKSAWEFFIGGYQPAQKWLKDRKDTNLTINDIFHYQKIIVSLFETERLMKEIDKIEIE